MSTASLCSRAGSGPWSVAAFALSIVGVGAATVIIVGSDSEPSQVLWPLVVLLVVLCAAPLLVPRRGALIGAAAGLAAWCVLAALTIGFLLWPALAALVIASIRERP